MTLASAWKALVQHCFPVFTQPTAQIFLRLVTGWVLCTARRTITGIIPFADPEGVRSHDIYHRFFSQASWNPVQLWEWTARFLVRVFCPTGVITTDTDDTLYHHSGRKMEGAGWWRDAVRSTGKKTVHGWGLNLVVLTLRVIPPWGGEPIGLPINLRLHRKDGPSLIDLAEEMLRQAADWLPDRSFRACMDGFYASLAGREIPRTQIISRLRRDAAIFELPPTRRKKQRGPKPKKGRRLPAPIALADQTRSWKTVTTHERGRERKRHVHTRDVLWYKVSHQPMRLVISRDPDGKERDDFFFTTDVSASPDEVISQFAGRWCIEDTFKNAKQLLGAQEPQCWSGLGPERAAVMGLALYSWVWTWYLQHGHRKKSWVFHPWYSSKSHPSFADALARLRGVLWRDRIISMFGKRAVHDKISRYLLPALERAA
jgi:hypothetical protein